MLNQTKLDESIKTKDQTTINNRKVQSNERNEIKPNDPLRGKQYKHS